MTFFCWYVGGRCSPLFTDDKSRAQVQECLDGLTNCYMGDFGVPAVPVYDVDGLASRFAVPAAAAAQLARSSAASGVTMPAAGGDGGAEEGEGLDPSAAAAVVHRGGRGQSVSFLRAVFFASFFVSQSAFFSAGPARVVAAFSCWWWRKQRRRADRSSRAQPDLSWWLSGVSVWPWWCGSRTHQAISLYASSAGGRKQPQPSPPPAAVRIRSHGGMALSSSAHGRRLLAMPPCRRCSALLPHRVRSCRRLLSPACGSTRPSCTRCPQPARLRSRRSPDTCHIVCSRTCPTPDNGKRRDFGHSFGPRCPRSMQTHTLMRKEGPGWKHPQPSERARTSRAPTWTASFPSEQRKVCASPRIPTRRASSPPAAQCTMTNLCSSCTKLGPVLLFPGKQESGIQSEKTQQGTTRLRKFFRS